MTTFPPGAREIDPEAEAARLAGERTSPRVPVLGDHVILLVDPAQNGGQDTAPAVVTRCWGTQHSPHPGPPLVNVRIFWDVPADGPRGDWAVTIPLYPTREDAVIAFEHATAGAVILPEGARPHGAFWPPKQREKPDA